MPSELSFSIPGLVSFLLVLVRVSSMFVFVPFPGIKSVPDAPKIAFSLCVTFALFPFWPVLTESPGLGLLTGWILLEVAFGVTVGLAVAFLAESFVLAAQMLGLQAGYSYASTVDPTNQSDATVLQVMVQLMSGILFFSLGLDRQVIRIFAQSLYVYPPGSFVPSASIAQALQHLGTAMFATGLRLALPVIALLLLIDLSLALLGRINSQLQLLTLAFPLKMLATLAALAGMATLFPAMLAKAANQTFTMLAGLLR